MQLKYPFSNPAIPYPALKLLNEMHERIQELESDAAEGTSTPAASQLDSSFFVGKIDADAVLADFPVGKAFHFQSDKNGISFSSANPFGTIINGDALFGSTTPLVVPGGVQGYITKGLSGNVNVVYTT